MRYFLILMVASLILTSKSFAADKSNGCGLGWYFFSKNTLLASSIRNSTNSVSPQSISMTSGTSGCAEHSMVKNDKRSIHFIEANYDHLRIDIAKGGGEFLSALAETLGCGWQGLPRFEETAKENFQYLFSDHGDKYSVTLEGFRELIHADAILRQQCSA